MELPIINNQFSINAKITKFSNLCMKKAGSRMHGFERERARPYCNSFLMVGTTSWWKLKSSRLRHGTGASWRRWVRKYFSARESCLPWFTSCTNSLSAKIIDCLNACMIVLLLGSGVCAKNTYSIKQILCQYVIWKLKNLEIDPPAIGYRRRRLRAGWKFKIGNWKFHPSVARCGTHSLSSGERKGKSLN